MCANLYYACKTKNTSAAPPMQSRKTETLTIRLYPETKAALRLAAEREQRSLSNMLDVMIKRYQGESLQLGPRSTQTDGVRAG